MDNLANRLNQIVETFIVENVPEQTKEEFAIAAIHFNINLNTCSKYDLMRIDHKAKLLVINEENKILTTAAIFSYIIYRELNRGQIEKEEKLNVKTAILNISTAITDYLTYRIDDETLKLNLFNELTQLGV